MTSKNTGGEPAKFGSRANIVGPVHRDDPGLSPLPDLVPAYSSTQAQNQSAPSQSLLDRHQKFAANYNMSKTETTQKGIDDSRQDRVLGGGARTPRSLAAQVQRQVDRNEETKGYQTFEVQRGPTNPLTGDTNVCTREQALRYFEDGLIGQSFGLLLRSYGSRRWSGPIVLDTDDLVLLQSGK